MGDIRSAPPAKLFIATLVARDGRDNVDDFDAAVTDAFGPIDVVSPSWPFEFTEYYTDEMGPNLIRRILSFEHLFNPADLPDAKHKTNDLERQLTQRFRTPPTGRIINLDAGYLTLGQIVLATTKSYSHRIYLRDGIWAEVTLKYHKGQYTKWDWSYPDYACGQYNDFWITVRDKLKQQIAEQQNNGA